MTVLRRLLGLAAILTVGLVFIQLSVSMREYVPDDDPLPLPVSILALALFAWIVASFVYGCKLLVYGLARREFAMQLLVSEGIILLGMYLADGRTAAFDLSSERIAQTLLLFGIPLILLLDLVLPPRPRPQAA